MIIKEETISSELIYQGRIVTLKKDIVKTIDQQTAIREIVVHRPAVVIVPFLNTETIIMVKQYRKAIESELLEIPAGLIEPNEDPLTAAKRELQEETGYLAKKWTPLGQAYASPGFCDELMHFFLAEDLTFTQTHLDEDEFVKSLEMSKTELEYLIQTHQIWDSKTITGYLLAVK